MKKVAFGILKKKNYTGLKSFFRKLMKKSSNIWVVEIHNKEIIVNWDSKNKIDDGFDGKEIGFELVAGKKPSAHIVTFYADIYKKMYPSS
jgi:hypothetical protein